MLQLDLVGDVSARYSPVQETLRRLLVDPRHVRTAGVHVAVWVRILDIPACLKSCAIVAGGR